MANGIGAFFAEGEVILWGSPCIGMTCDHDLGVGVVAEVVCKFIELGAFLGFDRKTVVRKKDSIGFKGFVVGGVGIAGAFGEGLIVNVVGAISEGCAVPLFVFVCAPGKDGEEG